LSRQPRSVATQGQALRIQGKVNIDGNSGFQPAPIVSSRSPRSPCWTS